MCVGGRTDKGRERGRETERASRKYDETESEKSKIIILQILLVIKYNCMITDFMFLNKL